MPFRKLFLSRWAALLWAGGIVWTAVDVVGFGPPAHAVHTADHKATDGDATPTDATGTAVDTADLAILANVMKGN
ncbi:hypothetical protein U1872_06610 [Sphingomonas sp. RB3P16]|uniref:hypothetical protein n=1 Tax=Parasphingomonas frigoris TaxID=3096163 RepID=UPI002FC80756